MERDQLRCPLKDIIFKWDILRDGFGTSFVGHVVLKVVIVSSGLAIVPHGDISKTQIPFPHFLRRVSDHLS